MHSVTLVAFEHQIRYARPRADSVGNPSGTVFGSTRATALGVTTNTTMCPCLRRQVHGCITSTPSGTAIRTLM